MKIFKAQRFLLYLNLLLFSKSSSSLLRFKIRNACPLQRNRFFMTLDNGFEPNGHSHSFISGGEEERVEINNFLSYLCEMPQSSWSPQILESRTSGLLRDGSRAYKQTISMRISKARDIEERQRLENVQSFLDGYLQQERRRASRLKVKEILEAASLGALEMDNTISKLSEEQAIDGDMIEYIDGLEQGERRKNVSSGTPSLLLNVLKALKHRVEAELQTKSRPEIRILAFALRLSDQSERLEYLQNAFKKLEELDNFVEFLREGVYYLDNGGIAFKSDMPYDNIDKMRVLLNESEKMRNMYLG